MIASSCFPGEFGRNFLAASELKRLPVTELFRHDSCCSQCEMLGNIGFDNQQAIPRITGNVKSRFRTKNDMKLIRRSVNGLMACAMVLAVTTSLMAADTGNPGIAKVVRVKGAARYMTTENPTWRPLKGGSILKTGTTIQTAAGSEVDLVLNNPKAANAVVPTAP